MYADDTTISNINQNVNEIVKNAELEKVNKINGCALINYH